MNERLSKWGIRDNPPMKDFQIVYVDTPPSRRGNAVSFGSWLPSKKKSTGGGGKGNLLWRKLINTPSARWSRSVSTVKNDIGSPYPWYDVMKMTLYLCVLPLKHTHVQSQSFHKRIIIKANRTAAYKMPDQSVVFQTVKVIKHKGSSRNCQSRGA